MRLDRQFLARGQDDDKLSGAAQDDGAMAEKNGGTSERIVVLVILDCQFKATSMPHPGSSAIPAICTSVPAAARDMSDSVLPLTAMAGLT